MAKKVLFFVQGKFSSPQAFGFFTFPQNIISETRIRPVNHAFSIGNRNADINGRDTVCNGGCCPAVKVITSKNQQQQIDQRCQSKEKDAESILLKNVPNGQPQDNDNPKRNFTGNNHPCNKIQGKSSLLTRQRAVLPPHQAPNLTIHNT